MIEGRLKWLSMSGEFGFVAPHNGSRDVFVRFSSLTGITRGEHTQNRVEVIAPAKGRGEETERLSLAAKVEVRTRYQVGHWAAGYEIAEDVGTGYHVRRPGSKREMLPEVFVPADVRRAGDR